MSAYIAIRRYDILRCRKLRLVGTNDIAASEDHFMGREVSELSAKSLRTVMVWDPLVRACHWLLVAAFFIAYFTEDDVLTRSGLSWFKVTALADLQFVGLIPPTPTARLG